MGTIEQLRRNLLDMTTEEKLERIREIRGERRINRNPTKAKADKKKKVSTISKLTKALQGLTPEQIAELLK